MLENFNINDEKEMDDLAKEAETIYNKKLYAKLVKLYGISNAKVIYEQMQREGEEEIAYLENSTRSR